MNENGLRCLISDQDSTRQKPFAKIAIEKENLKEIIASYDITYSTESNWIEKQIVPLEALLSKDAGLEDLCSQIRYVTDYADSARFKLPENPASCELAYVIGLAAGDGGFSNDNLWTLVDGGKDEQLQYSEKFLESVAGMIETIFGVNTGLRKRENRFELYISNKWFCRFLRNFYGLPRSYKKGKLSKPEIFDGEESMKHFWRGVFDADGSVAKKSNRVSLSSATRSFLEECRSDFNKLGIDVHEIRKPAAYLLRLKPDQMPVFAEQVGFSHPRKRSLLLEKLENGSRSYKYEGKTENYIGEFYDLTKIDRLRAFDIGKKIREYREEKDLYQKELADKLEVSENQIYYWENDKYAIPISALEKIFDSKKGLLNYLMENENRFKYGKRGNKNSPVILPKRRDQDAEEIAEKCIATSNELRIKSNNQSIARKLEWTFNVQVKEKNKLVVDNLTVFNFFDTFYNYERKFAAWNDREISRIENKLQL